ncbi:hypothetical protein L211DRAFT_550356 [Terfezia boudieri ATCC MYA-4762]|uniref:Uncharacterized protein n=1 Tax=Terfezia boudieri ATCC MYA-4762 TaxID=1051890 RepID=A0A3N4M0R2_9PEZI|nr:hypothetical protein L211DRAFT_550356 [Terfezia boudieri ATCC MYA-4762]
MNERDNRIAAAYGNPKLKRASGSLAMVSSVKRPSQAMMEGNNNVLLCTSAYRWHQGPKIGRAFYIKRALFVFNLMTCLSITCISHDYSF